MKGIRSWPKKWVSAMTILILACPLGILIVWGYGDAWGEWGEVGSWVPQQWWTAPLKDYNFEGWDSQLMASIGYVLSAVVGVIVIVLFTYALSVGLSRKDGGKTGRQGQ